MFIVTEYAALIIPRLSEHEQFGAIDMLQAGCMFLTSHDIIIAIR